MSAGWIVLCAVAAILLMHQRRKRKGQTLRWTHVLGGILLALLLMAVTGAGYFAVYHHRDASAEPYLSGGEKVQVISTDNGLFFDGPSEERAVIFYPGAKVEAAAYAPLLYQIAEEWGDCFLVEMPLHMAVLNVDAAREIQDHYAYPQWFMAGHSLGGSAAALYTQEHPEQIDGLILLASYSTRPLPQDLICVSIRGDQDGILDPEEYEKNRDNLPETVQEVVIAGGNHAQFGNYGSQRGDGTARISWAEQQRQVLDALKAA